MPGYKLGAMRDRQNDLSEDVKKMYVLSLNVGKDKLDDCYPIRRIIEN
jgi:hypothetical protein